MCLLRRSSVFFVWLEFHRHSQFHITTPRRVIRIMHYSPTLQQIQASRGATHFTENQRARRQPHIIPYSFINPVYWKLVAVMNFRE